MINCLYCKKEFTPKSKKAVYCCDKCRNYANREKKNLPINEKMYFIDHNGVKRLLTKETLTDLLTRFDGVDSANVIRKKTFNGRLIISNDEFRIPAQPTTKSSLDGSNVDFIKFDESLMYEPPKRYTVAQYKERIDDARAFENDLKDVMEEIKNDNVNINAIQRRDLLSYIGLTK